MLLGVLQEILDNERGVSFFTGDKQFGRQFLFDFHRSESGSAPNHRAILQQLTEIHRLGLYLEVTGVHAR